MRDADLVTHVIPVLPSPVLRGTGGGMVGDLPLSVLLADEAMQDLLRSAGHTVSSFMQQWREFSALYGRSRPLAAAA